MNINIKKDFAVSIFFAVLSIAYLYGTQSISVFSPFGQQGLDSKSVPQIIGGLTLLLSISLFITTLIRYRKSRSETEYVQAEEIATKKKFPIKLVASIVLLSLYIGLYQSLGFIVSSIAYLILQSLLLIPTEKRKKWTLFIIVLSVVFTVTIYFVFSKYLTLFLPSGILG
ncbi:putative tricarboxylic transport membrane protein [Cricetibacter osteomyelitidis]|uniref:Putative tricarboxylic transport membrane protein n=1 Tax=Cricetibacter osteomyelitidis TaxID=1521931 RepID=A0A4V2T2K4_9PAST|nr:tripartite tricarboxylate transporter TctB family protein [Cricetibacter osteomyelitidis]TCP97733.1 putative tricarboxylic transport membrane protein [Cricetibacter osteomyelitidis]